MSHRLPPLNGLRAFEVAARHLSFTHAASELYLTRSAVAQQVRKLEEALGQKLFNRRRNRLTLTPAGEAYVTQVTSAFHAISKATEDIAPALKGRVFRLGVAPELMQRNTQLAQVLRAPPAGLRLRLVRGYDLDALHDGTADAILRTGDGPSPAYNIEVVSLDHFGIQSPTVRLITQPGLAGCREQRALLRLLRGKPA
jgi:LysR family glycine cleavage system transcriptional activator